MVSSLYVASRGISIAFTPETKLTGVKAIGDRNIGHHAARRHVTDARWSVYNVAIKKARLRNTPNGNYTKKTHILIGNYNVLLHSLDVFEHGHGTIPAHQFAPVILCIGGITAKYTSRLVFFENNLLIIVINF